MRENELAEIEVRTRSGRGADLAKVCHEDVPRLIAEVARQAVILRQIGELHSGPRTERHGSGCIECSLVWPCPTRLVLGGADNPRNRGGKP